MSDETIPDQHLRIFVPGPDPGPETELIYGTGPNNFVGIMGRAHDGGIFLGASGGLFGLPRSDSNYASFKKLHTGLNIGISGMGALALVARTPWAGKNASIFDAVVNSAVFGLGVVSGVKAGIDGGLGDPKGNVSIYGDSGIAAVSPLTFAASGGASASLNGGLVASVNAIGAATVNGVIAALHGVWKAVIDAHEANVIGDGKVLIASRGGPTTIEGDTIEIGKASNLARPGYSNPGVLDFVLSGYQNATKRVEIQADDSIRLEPGKATDKIAGVPVKVHVTKDHVRADSENAALMLSKEAVLQSGSSVLHLGSSGAKLMAPAVGPKQAADAVIKAAETAWKTAHNAADLAYKSVEAGEYLIIAQAIGLGVGGLAGIIAGSAGQTPLAKGLGGVGAAAGGLLGSVAVGGAVGLIKKKIASRARDAAKKVADEIYKGVVDGALQAEAQALKIAGNNLATPRVEVTATGVKIVAGLSELSVTPSGIDLKCPPAGKVSVNGHTFAYMPLSLLSVD